MAHSHCLYFERIDNSFLKPINKTQWDWLSVRSRSDGKYSGVNGPLLDKFCFKLKKKNFALN